MGVVAGDPSDKIQVSQVGKAFGILVLVEHHEHIVRLVVDQVFVGDHQPVDELMLEAQL